MVLKSRPSLKDTSELRARIVYDWALIPLRNNWNGSSSDVPEHFAAICDQIRQSKFWIRDLWPNSGVVSRALYAGMQRMISI